MKKKKTKPARRKQQKRTAAAASAETIDDGRRNALRLARNGVLGSAALGGIGWWVVTGVRATAAEQDLTRLGNGHPAIVQIHDPQCAMCTELQRETRKALRCFDEEDIPYLVASIRTEPGSRFAATHGLPHVTLVLMDENGVVKEVLQGVRRRDELKPHFQSLVGRA